MADGMNSFGGRSLETPGRYGRLRPGSVNHGLCQRQESGFSPESATSISLPASFRAGPDD